MTPAQQIQDLFRPVIGQLAWSVRGGHGSFLTLEFGKPHIAIREPIEAKPERSARVRRQLARRRVHIVGDWHLWIQYSDWKLSAADGSLDRASIGASPDECLLDLDGQRLVAVESGALPHSWTFKFDLGATLQVWPSTAYAPTDDQWSLHGWNGDVGDLRIIAALRGDGTVVVAKA
jgi:hypothetical protein